MTAELIYDLDCPNIAKARAVLIEALAGSGSPVRWTEWSRSAPDSPGYVTKYGSPTVLVDARDVAGEQPRDGSDCCRLYRGSDGSTQGMPTVGVIADALKLSSVDSPRSRAVGWKNTVVAVPGIVFAFLPNLACPACWPAYAGLLGAFGLGFLLDHAYLLPLTVGFLVLTLGAMAYRARSRRGYGPFVVGLIACAAVLLGKFVLASDPTMYTGIGLLVVSSFWNAWPTNRKDTGCPVCVSEDLISNPQPKGPSP